jgi:hypothetical protein
LDLSIFPIELTKSGPNTERKSSKKDDDVTTNNSTGVDVGVGVAHYVFADELPTPKVIILQLYENPNRNTGLITGLKIPNFLSFAGLVELET